MKRTDPSAPSTRPLVVVAPWSVDPETLGETGRALLGVHVPAPHRRGRADSFGARPVADTLRVLKRRGYDTVVHPVTHPAPDYAVLTQSRGTRIRSLVLDAIAETFVPGGRADRRSGHHARTIEMPFVPTADVRALEAAIVRVLEAPLLDAAGMTRLAVTMAAIAAVDDRGEQADLCAAPTPWRDGWVSSGERDDFASHPMDPRMSHLLPDVIEIRRSDTDGRPDLTITQMLVRITEASRPDPLTVMRTIERLRHEPFA